MVNSAIKLTAKIYLKIEHFIAKIYKWLCENVIVSSGNESMNKIHSERKFYGIM